MVEIVELPNWISIHVRPKSLGYEICGEACDGLLRNALQQVYAAVDRLSALTFLLFFGIGGCLFDFLDMFVKFDS